MTKEKKPTVRDKTFQMLKCNLTNDELLQCGQQLADAQQTIDDVAAELDDFKAQCKSKTATAEALAARLGKLIRQRYEHRRVECEIVKDYHNEAITIVRGDTGEIVERRDMTHDELAQLPL